MVTVLVLIVVAAALLLTLATSFAHFVLGLWRATPEGGGTWTGIVFMSIPAVLAIAMVAYAAVRLIIK